ncbi:MAG: transposase [Ignavibacteriales bacterium]|nr:transposase [Ignavibacteriales bacterium]
MKKTPKTPAFKPYDQHQMFLFPPSIEDMIPENHPVRIVNKVLDTISYKSLFDRYPGGGTSSYNPVMLVKVTSLSQQYLHKS